MRIYTAVLLIAAFSNLAQATTANPQAAAPEQSPARAPESQTIVIPAGTRIPMSLASPIQVKSARPGAAVRAVTGFPVTVGSQLAIPAGTYVEGVIDKLVKHGRTGPTLQMHFTRILYSNGYSTAIDGANVMARLITPGDIEEGDAFAGKSGDGEALDSAIDGTDFAPQRPLCGNHGGHRHWRYRGCSGGGTALSASSRRRRHRAGVRRGLAVRDGSPKPATRECRQRGRGQRRRTIRFAATCGKALTLPTG